MLVFILGYMASGKTTLGRQLARLMNYRFYDMDEMIELSSGYTISKFFEKFGEQAFRLKEREILLSHLQDSDAVIATGGGTPCYENNMELMNLSGVTIFIDTDLQVIIQRLSGKLQSRPLLKNIPADRMPAFISEHMESRKVFYMRAKIRVRMEELNLDELVGMIKDI